MKVCVCDRCGRKIEENEWQNVYTRCTFPRIRTGRTEKPMTIEEIWNDKDRIIDKVDDLPDATQEIQLKIFYRKSHREFELCPKCREEFERFMKNEEIKK